MRPSGYYWVKDHIRRDWSAPHAPGWRICYYNAAMAYWVLGFVAFNESREVAGDARWLEIGDRIPHPEEAAR